MRGRLFVFFALFLLSVFFLATEQPDQSGPWYLISEMELRSIEQYKEKSEAERQSWLSQVQGLRTRAENSEARSSRLETESGNLDQQLAQAREQQRKSEELFNKYEADWLMTLSLKNGEIATLESEKADKTTQAEKYKGQARSRLIMVIVLVGVWIVFIGIKICRKFRVILF